MEVRKDTLLLPIQTGANIASYSTQVFEFTETHLDEVVRTLSEGYHVRVELANASLSQCRYTGRYVKEPLDATLSVIAETMNLTVKRVGDTYVLDGNGCQ